MPFSASFKNLVGAAIICLAGLELSWSGCAQPVTLTNQWAVDVGSYSDSSPAVGKDGTIYFGTFFGDFYALTSDGAIKWVFHAGHEIWSSPAVGDDNTVFFGGRDRQLYALGPDGKRKWSFHTGAWVDSSPALARNGTIYVGSWDKKFYAVNPDGSKQWDFPTGGPVVSSPGIDAGGRIYFGSHDGKFYALTPEGTKAWEFATGGPIISSPALDRKGGVFFTSVNGFLYALNVSGALKWRLKTGGITHSSPVIAQDGTLYVGVNEEIWGIAPEGEVKWQQPATTDEYQQPIEATPALLADGSVCIVSGYGLLGAMQLERGYKWTFYLHGHGHSSPAIGPSGTVYTRWKWNSFDAIPAAVPLARSPWPKFRGNPQNTGRLGSEADAETVADKSG